MSDYLWIQNGHLLDPANQIHAAKDLYIAEGRIVSKLSESQKASAEKWNARGLMVAPGLVDLNARLGYPGPSHRETIATGTRAAAAGGFTSLLCMPDTTPMRQCGNFTTTRRQSGPRRLRARLPDWLPNERTEWNRASAQWPTAGSGSGCPIRQWRAHPKQ